MTTLSNLLDRYCHGTSMLMIADMIEVTAIAAADLAQEILALMVSPMYGGATPAAQGGKLNEDAKKEDPISGDGSSDREIGEGVHDEL